MKPNRGQEKSLRDIQLPTALQRKAAKQYLTAVAITLLVVILAIYYVTPIYLAGLAIPAALVYLAMATSYDFDSGKIAEMAVVCNGVTGHIMRDTTHVTFRTDDEDPKFFSFIIPGKTAKRDFFPNAPYLIYFRPERPQELIGYTQL